MKQLFQKYNLLKWPVAVLAANILFGAYVFNLIKQPLQYLGVATSDMLVHVITVLVIVTFTFGAMFGVMVGVFLYQRKMQLERDGEDGLKPEKMIENSGESGEAELAGLALICFLFLNTVVIITIWVCRTNFNVYDMVGTLIVMAIANLIFGAMIGQGIAERKRQRSEEEKG